MPAWSPVVISRLLRFTLYALVFMSAGLLVYNLSTGRDLLGPAILMIAALALRNLLRTGRGAQPRGA